MEDRGTVVALTLERSDMALRQCARRWIKAFKRMGAGIAPVVLFCVRAGAEGMDPMQMLESMRANFVLESGTAIGNRIEAEASWRMKEDGPALRAGSVVDQWQVLSDGERFGTERFRRSPDGDRRTRTVYQGEERREFEFDLSATGKGAVAGKLNIRHQFFFGPNIRLPLQDYLDRLCGPPGRRGFTYDSLELATEKVPVDGHLCHEIRGSWSGRDFTFWLDPEFGYLPRKYTMKVSHGDEFSGRRRGWRNPADQRLLLPPPEIDQNVIPLRSEENLSAVEFIQRDGRFYIARAVLERTQYFDIGAVYSHRAVLQTGDYVSDGRRDVKGFLDFNGLLADGTPVEETWQDGGPMSPRPERYVLSEGKKLPHYGSFKLYLSDLRDDLRRLGRDFSLQNLQRIDSKFLIAVCAIAALLINGGIAYANYRKNRTKPS